MTLITVQIPFPNPAAALEPDDTILSTFEAMKVVSTVGERIALVGHLTATGWQLDEQHQDSDLVNLTSFVCMRKRYDDESLARIVCQHMMDQAEGELKCWADLDTPRERELVWDQK